LFGSFILAAWLGFVGSFTGGLQITAVFYNTNKSGSLPVKFKSRPVRQGSLSKHFRKIK